MKQTKTVLKYCGLAIAGLTVYLLALEYPWIATALGAAFVGLIVRDLVKHAVREVLDEELRTLREQSYANRTDLETVDRKVSAIWDRIRAIGGS